MYVIDVLEQKREDVENAMEEVINEFKHKNHEITIPRMTNIRHTVRTLKLQHLPILLKDNAFSFPGTASFPTLNLIFLSIAIKL